MKYILILLMLGGMAKGQNATNNIAKNIIDSCQRYRDSVAKYDKNIQVWQRQLSPNNPPGYNILLQEKISAMATKREEFVQKAKKCKP